MRSYLIAVNVLLVAAVIFLFIKIYSPSTIVKSDSSSKVSSNNAGSLKNASIAFVELDSLNEKINFIKDRRKELEVEQKAIETEWQNGYRELENRKNEFLKRGSSITQQDAEKFQGELLQQQQRVDERKQ